MKLVNKTYTRCNDGPFFLFNIFEDYDKDVDENGHNILVATCYICLLYITIKIVEVYTTE